MDKSIKKNVTPQLQVTLIPNQRHEFLMPTKEVALAYGVTVSNLRVHKHNYKDELFEGKHFISSVKILNGAVNATQTTMWTKRGIVRLGFFIKSERAKLFRDWAEDLVITELENHRTTITAPTLPETPKRKHNRLTVERLNDIMYYVCRIEDKDLRMTITDKLHYD